MKLTIAFFLGLVLTLASAWVPYRTDERAMYGSEGPLEETWLPREVAGWPAPFLADNPGTSVLHQIGPEDDFRAWPFVATFSFWFLVALSVVSSARWRARRSRSRPPPRK